ncbi:hypothetical protein HY388_01535 [Candidatus Daviesbacteria bacterium]|nr:hypothetical protein [Candidatus Daviesbacteria bacterium]
MGKLVIGLLFLFFFLSTSTPTLAAIIVGEGEACSPPATDCDSGLVCRSGVCVNPRGSSNSSLGTITAPSSIQKFGTGTEGISKFLNNLFSLFLVVGVIVALITLLWGGIHYITAGGDKQATQTAREKMTAAIIGLVLLFSVYLLLNTLGQFLGIDIGKLTIPTP